MPSTARIRFNISNLTFSIAALLKGISFVEGLTLRGPIADPRDIITSWPQFEKIFGGLMVSTDFPLLCKRALDRGAQLRVNRMVHYADPTDASTTTAVKATATAFANATPANLFTLTMKHAGADYNNIRATVSAASNGNANYFNLTISHINDSSLTERYENLFITGLPTVQNSHYLDKVIKGSLLVGVTYSDLSGLSGQQRPVNVVKSFASGSDGGTVVIADYVGDSASKVGLYAFDTYDDSMQICAPEISDTDLHIAGSAYAANRTDLQYLAHLDNALTTATALIAERDGTSIDSMYTRFFAGGVIVNDPVTGLEKQISELGDVLGTISYSDNVAHEWFSSAGTTRGQIFNALGVVNNFGSAGLTADLELLAQHQINMVVKAGGEIYVSGNFSGQLTNDVMSFNNAVRLIIFQQKSLGPALRKFLEEPADLPTMKSIFRGVEPFFEKQKVERAIFSYVWDGDQNISKIEDAQVNNLTDLQNGKYKVRLYEKLIPSMNEITVDIVVTPLSVSFNVIQAQQ